MHVLDPTQQELEEWRPGVRTRMLVWARNGARALCVFEQICDPGTGAPMHEALNVPGVEEVLTVVAGTAEVWLGDDRINVAAGRSVIVPDGERHGFRNIGEDILHIHALLAAPIFEAVFDGSQETRRRWATN